MTSNGIEVKWNSSQRFLRCYKGLYGRPMFDSGVGKIPWRREWQPTPVFLPGESHGQRSLAGYSLWRCKELDTIEAIQHTHANEQMELREVIVQILTTSEWS